MRGLIKSFFVIACLVFLVSCAGKPVAPPEYNYAEKNIQLAIKADKELNRYEGVPHTLMVCVYQLDSLNAFNLLAGDIDGLYTLLECSSFDSVTFVKPLFIQPGKLRKVDFDRVENTRYVGVVAGYNKLERDGVVRIFEIPIKQESSGFIRKKVTEKPDILNIDLVMGAERINN